MSNPRKEDPVKHCDYCGKRLERKTVMRHGVPEMEAHSTFVRRRYCDRACMAADYEGKPRTLTPTARTLRERARKIKGLGPCEQCGAGGLIDVHHRDGDLENNSLENLDRLCRKCHVGRHRGEHGQWGAPSIDRPQATSELGNDVDGTAWTARGRGPEEEREPVSPALRGSSGGGSRQMVRTYSKRGAHASDGGEDRWEGADVGRTLNASDAHRPNVLVEHSASADDAEQEDGTGRGVPIVGSARDGFELDAEVSGSVMPDGRGVSPHRNQAGTLVGQQPMAFPTDGDERCGTRPSEEVTPTVRSRAPAVLDTYNQNQVLSDEEKRNVERRAAGLEPEPEGSVANTLSTTPNTAVSPPIPAGWGHGGGNVDGLDESVGAVHGASTTGDGVNLPVSPTLHGSQASAAGRAPHPSGDAPVVADGSDQGDDAFDPPPDGRRYAACGDGVASPCAHWIGLRLLAVMRGLDPDAVRRGPPVDGDSDTVGALTVGTSPGYPGGAAGDDEMALAVARQKLREGG